MADGSRLSTIGDTIRAGLTSPGFGLVYRGWAEIVGDSATTAQLLVLGIGVVTPVAILLVGLERRLPVYAALLGAIVLATAPAHVVYSTRLKQYTAEALIATLVLWAAWRVLDRATDGTRWALLAGFAIAASLLSSVGVVVAGTAIAVALVAALVARPRRLRPAVIGTAVYGVVAGFWTLLAVAPSSKLENFWREYYLNRNDLAGGLSDRMQGVARGFGSLDEPLVLAVVFIAAALVLARRPLLGLLLVMPTVVAIGLAALKVLPLGTERIEIYLYPSYALLLAVAVAEVALLTRGWARVATISLALVAALGLAVNANPISADSYPREDLTPLVHQVEAQRRPGDVVVVYPSAGYAYGLATRYPIETVDADSGTGWAVKVGGPNIMVLPPHRTDPERWGPQLDRLAADADRIWVIGSHLHQGPGGDYYPDWPALLSMLEARGYEIVDTEARPGAELILMRQPPREQP